MDDDSTVELHRRRMVPNDGRLQRSAASTPVEISYVSGRTVTTGDGIGGQRFAVRRQRPSQRMFPSQARLGPIAWPAAGRAVHSALLQFAQRPVGVVVVQLGSALVAKVGPQRAGMQVDEAFMTAAARVRLQLPGWASADRTRMSEENGRSL